MKKIISILLCLAMVLSFALVASAESTTVTASKNVSDLIKQYGWTQNTTKQQFTLDDNVTVKINGGSNTGKAYNGDHIRIYATDTPAGTITISVPEGCELVSVKITTVTGTYAHLCVDGTTTDISNKTTAVAGNSVVLKSVKNGSNGKQVRVKAFEVVYTTSSSAPEHQHNSDVVKFDATGHWTECTCGENKSTVTPHTLTNHVCECGFVGNPTTVEEIIKCLYQLPKDGKIPGKHTLTGKVTKIDEEGWNSQYQNITVTIAVEGFEDYPIVCYRMKSTDNADASIVKVGDIITVTGELINFNGTKEFTSNCTLDAYTVPGEGEGEGEGGGDVVNPGEGEGGGDVVNPGEGEGGGDVTPPAPVFGVVNTLVPGTAYKFGMVQGNLDNAVYYLAGGMDGFYMATTTNVADAIDVYVETTDGGYYFYTIIDGAKTYINMVVSADGAHVNGAYEATASTVYTFENGTLIATIDGEPYWFGTRNDKQYTTMGPCKTSYEGFYGKFYGDTNPGTGDSFTSVVIAMMAISAIGAGILISKKKEF